MLSVSSHIIKTRYVIAIAISLAACILYIPAFNNHFVNLDDDVYVYDNKHIRQIDTNLFRWVFSIDANPTWHPLTLLTFAFDYALNGVEPYGYHRTNILLHTVNSLLFFLFTIRLLSLKHHDQIREKRILLCAAVSSLFFAIHPLSVESTAWISERKGLLCALFYLLALHTYVGRPFHSGRSRSLSYAMCIIFCILALLSKPTAISLPFVFLILDFAMERFTNEKKSIIILEKIPFLILSSVAGWMNILSQSSGGAFIPLDVHPLTNRLYVAIWGYVFYIVKILFPFNIGPLYPYPSELSPVFAYPVEPELLHVSFIPYVVILALITSVFIRMFKVEKLYLSLWLFYLVTLLPVIGLFPLGHHAAADRYAYIPGMSLFIIIGLSVSSFLERIGKFIQGITYALIIVIAGSHALLTLEQMHIWKTSVSLWTHVIRISRGTSAEAQAYYDRGNAYKLSGIYRSAIADYNQAISLNPFFTEAYCNRGISYKELRDFKRALSDFESAIQLDPYILTVYLHRSELYEKLGNNEASQRDYETAFSINSKAALAHFTRD